MQKKLRFKVIWDFLGNEVDILFLHNICKLLKNARHSPHLQELHQPDWRNALNEPRAIRPELTQFLQHEATGHVSPPTNHETTTPPQASTVSNIIVRTSPFFFWLFEFSLQFPFEFSLSCVARKWRPKKAVAKVKRWVIALAFPN